MRIMISIFATGALVGAALPASATGSSDSEDRMICKKQKKTGTRFVTKICRPASEWEEMAEQNRRAANEMINRPKIDDSRGG